MGASHGRRVGRPDTLLAESDFITIHLPRRKRRRTSLTPRRWRRQAGVRIINVGEVASSTKPIWPTPSRNGHVQGAPRRVSKRSRHGVTAVRTAVGRRGPTPRRLDLRSAGQGRITIAEQVQLALAGDFVPYAVNVAAGEVSNAFVPFMGLAEVLVVSSADCWTGSPLTWSHLLGELAGSGPRSSTLCCAQRSFSRRPATTGLLRQRAAIGRRPQPQCVIARISTVESPEYVNQISVRSETTWCRHVGHIGTRLENAHCRALTVTASRSLPRPRCRGAQRRPTGHDRHGGVALGEAGRFDQLYGRRPTSARRPR